MKSNLFAELRRRNVLRAAILYIGAVWALSQGIAQLGPAFGMPEWGTRWFVIACLIGFPFWIAFAWFYEFTPEGLKRESEVERRESITHHTGRKLDFAIIGVLAVAVILLLTDRFVLRQGVNADVAVPEKSVAVLPFVNLSSDKEQEYFSDGISEELLNLLAKVPELQVTARASSFSFKGKETGIPEIARTLHVAHILEGSVRKAGNQVRITAQLVDVAKDAQLWSQTWDRKLDDIFAIQDEIAADVVKALRVTLLGAAPRARTTDPAAYALYLQAVQLGRQITPEALAKSDELYRQALAIDPDYAPAWDELAHNFSNAVSISVLSNSEGFARCREAAMKALSIDPDYAPAHARLGWVALHENDMSSAAQHFERALTLDPADSRVLEYAASLLLFLGRMNEGLALQEALVQRDPVNVMALNSLANAQRYMGRLDAAISTFRTALSLSPGRGAVHFQFGMALLRNGDAAGALSEIEKETSEVWKLIGHAIAYHAIGRNADSDQALAELFAKYEQDWSYNIAYVYASRGEATKAFEWLDKAVGYRDPGLAEIVVETLFDDIRQDARWLPFLRKIGKAPEQLAKIEFKVTLPQSDAGSALDGPAEPKQ